MSKEILGRTSSSSSPKTWTSSSPQKEMRFLAGILHIIKYSAAIVPATRWWCGGCLLIQGWRELLCVCVCPCLPESAPVFPGSSSLDPCHGKQRHCLAIVPRRGFAYSRWRLSHRLLPLPAKQWELKLPKQETEEAAAREKSCRGR